MAEVVTEEEGRMGTGEVDIEDEVVEITVDEVVDTIIIIMTLHREDIQVLEGIIHLVDQMGNKRIYHQYHQQMT